MFLNSFNLSYNNLTGDTSRKSTQDTFFFADKLKTLLDPSIYSNNPGLCGFPLSIACTNHSSSTTSYGLNEPHQDLKSLFLYYSTIAGVVFGFWLLFGALFFCKSRRFAFFGFINSMQFKFLQKMKHVWEQRGLVSIWWLVRVSDFSNSCMICSSAPWATSFVFPQIRSYRLHSELLFTLGLP